MILRPIKWYAKLLTSKGRKSEGKYLVEGVRAVKQLISSKTKIAELLLSEESSAEFPKHIDSRILTQDQLNKISETQNGTTVVAVVEADSQIYSSTLPDDCGDTILFLEDVQDPGNVGTLIRCAAAFGFDGVVMSNNCADPLSPKVVRSTVGAIEALWIRRTANYKELVLELKESDFLLITADIGGGELLSKENSKTIFALGNEGNGVSKWLKNSSDKIYTIPFESERIESLNVSVAGAIGMSSIYNQN
jgi:TrmH family RNA methyltransferase